MSLFSARRPRPRHRRRPRTRLSLIEQLEDRILLTAEFRSIDGSGNNVDNPEYGAAGTQLLRLTTVEYEDGISVPAGGFDGSGRPNPREISNVVVAQPESILNDRFLTGFVFQWGQFLDHDLDLTEEAIPVENFSISVPADDPDLDPNVPIPLLRSRFDTATGFDTPRQQINQITSFLDASNVYGSDDVRAEALRTGVGGLLKTSDGVSNVGGDFLPFNFLVDGEPLHNAAPPPLEFDDYFVAGDIRVNEQPGLTSLHTLFLREHNRLAAEIAARDFTDADLSDPEVDEAIYQQARRLVGAKIQAITYNEFLPALLGPDGLTSYEGYDETVNPSVANIFSAALYRVGHTMLPNELLRLDDNGVSLVEGPVALGDAFFDPSLITDFDIDPYLKGLSIQQIQEIDSHVVDGVRNLLFDPPAQFDLAAINVQRGRDHGLPDFNQARIDFGLNALSSFSQISSDPAVAAAIAEAYGGDINNIDVWLGGISEDHVAGGSVGELIHTVLVDQFSRTRDGDRFYYESNLYEEELIAIQNTRLADVIRRNTSLENIQDEVFRDESVFVYRAPAGEGPAEITLRVRGDFVQVVDNADGSVLAESRRDETTTVVLFGTSENDRIVIDSSADGLRVPVEVHGNGGDGDVLTVEGTRRSDSIRVQPTEIVINDRHIFYGTIETVDIQAGRGNDLAVVDGPVEAHTIINGGRGSDMLLGGTGNEVLIGGRGADLLSGGLGNDILIGGLGIDLVFGGPGEDIVIGGRTAHDDNTEALLALLAEWTSDHDYESRVANLSGEGDGLNGEYFLISEGPEATVFDDHRFDLLSGGIGLDWFFANIQDDLLLGRRRNEVLN